MSLLHTLLERTGTRFLPRQESEDGKRHFLRAIGYTSEFRRIEALPRREWNVEPQVTLITELLTRELKTEQGKMQLWKVQAAALAEIAKQRGGFFPIGVGQGKALISLLASMVLDCERPVLFVPAALRDQTLAYVIPAMREHWKLDPRLRVIGYSELSLEKNADMLDQLEPDLIILDECHYLKRSHAGRTRRMVRYFREHPDTLCIALSGTISNRSIIDWSHIAKWALKESAPIPSKWTELSEWSDALDERVPDEQRPMPGALKRFCAEGETPRQGFRRRLTETPGVVATSENDLGVSLQIARLHVDTPVRVAQAIERLRRTWETPQGDLITEAMDLWRHIRELALGFWYRWDPAPPRSWLDARRDWKRYVRETLKHNRRGLDTELQVWNESAKKPHKEFEAWRDGKDTFKPNTIAEWIDSFAVDASFHWLSADGGICWHEHQAFGQALAKKQIPVFGAGDNSIIDTPHKAIAASIAAHSEGKNLQRFSRNLVVSPMTSGKAWEQLLGRTHRHGQDADVVTCDVFLHVSELEVSFQQARADAKYLEDTYGNRQKLNYADIA